MECNIKIMYNWIYYDLNIIGTISPKEYLSFLDENFWIVENIGTILVFVIIQFLTKK